MKINLLPLIFTLLFTSCVSEYEERLQRARELVSEIEEVKSNQDLLGYSCEPEIAELQKEILLHARVSGNQEKFFEELYAVNTPLP